MSGARFLQRDKPEDFWEIMACSRSGEIAKCLVSMGWFLWLGGFNLLAASVELQWDPSPETDPANYRVHYGKASRDYTESFDVGDRIHAKVTGLEEGTVYFFAVTYSNQVGMESDYSNEVSLQGRSHLPSAVMPPPFPLRRFETLGIFSDGEVDAPRVDLNLMVSGSGRTEKSIKINVKGAPGSVCHVESSENLRDWNDVARLVMNESGFSEYGNSDFFRNRSMKFYRVRFESQPEVRQ